MKRKLEILILSAGGLLGLVWAITTNHFPALGFKLDYLIDLSSLLTVASFSVIAMLPLRALAVASQIFAIPYFMLQPTPLWTPVGWTGLFLAINIYHITRILLERRPVKFTADEQQLYDLTFPNFEPRDFLKLLSLGEWKTGKQGDNIVTRGQPIAQIAVPISCAWRITGHAAIKFSCSSRLHICLTKFWPSVWRRAVSLLDFADRCSSSRVGMKPRSQ
jgi:xanthosine utilization system XapX-like protein